MIMETSSKQELVMAIDEPVLQLVNLMSSLNENEVNKVPYKGSWTAGQLFRHVAKSTNGIATAMLTAAKPAERDVGERIPELKKTFLDFENKMQSPDEIIPENGPYEKEAIIKELTQSFERWKESAADVNLTGVVIGLPLGSITKLELLHFVLYHTQRHLHQMKKIVGTLKHT